MKKSIGIKLAELNRLIHRHFSKRKLSDGADNANKCGLTMSSSYIIGYLHSHGDTDIYQRDLEEELEVRRSTMSKELSLMEEKGFIKRESQSHDKRLKKIVLCDKATSIIQKIQSEHNLLEQTMTKGISDEELEAFFKTLSKIADNLREEKL